MYICVAEGESDNEGLVASLVAVGDVAVCGMGRPKGTLTA